MHVLALAVDLHLPDCRSLKAKRAALRPITDTVRRRFAVAVSEVGDQDKWQRGRIGVVTVAPTAGHATDVIDEVERHIWAQPGIVVLESERHWLETS